VSGHKQGRLLQETYANKVYGRLIDGLPVSAIQITTASGICAVLDLLAQGQLPARGFVRQEQIPLAAFLANRFGAAYAMPQSAARAA
jgi:saccharopine dehydrogenase-like NADP-dependent oxidoreductase